MPSFWAIGTPAGRVCTQYNGDEWHQQCASSRHGAINSSTIKSQSASLKESPQQDCSRWWPGKSEDARKGITIIFSVITCIKQDILQTWFQKLVEPLEMRENKRAAVYPCITYHTDVHEKIKISANGKSPKTWMKVYIPASAPHTFPFFTYNRKYTRKHMPAAIPLWNRYENAHGLSEVINHL